MKHIIVCLFLLAGCSNEPSKPALLRKSYASETLGTHREYWLSLPKDYNDHPTRQWPVILFLHGGGERGDSLGAVLKHGPIMEAGVQGRDLPFIIVAPQLHPSSREGNEARSRRPPRRRRTEFVRETGDVPAPWGKLGPPDGWSKLEKDLLQILDRTLEEYRADPDRVYLTGISYGGYGTWYMATNHPDRWAAVAPISGVGYPPDMVKIAKLPVWYFHGGKDALVRVEWSLPTLRALQEAGGNLRVTVHEDRPHNTWTRVYEGEDLYSWFLSHERGESSDSE